MGKHKTKGIECSSAKRWASLDISEECGESKFYTMNYVYKESLVLNYCKKANKAIRF